MAPLRHPWATHAEGGVRPDEGRARAAHHIEVADVAAAFAVADLTASAQATSAWTWFCSPDHFGNVHPNNAGYRIIADAFLDAIGP